MKARKRMTVVVTCGALALSALGAGSAWAVPANFTGSGSGGASLVTPLVFKTKISPTTTYAFTCTAAQVSWNGVGFSTGFTPGVGSGGTLTLAFQGNCTAPNGSPAIVTFYNFGVPLGAEKNGSVFTLRGTDSAMMTINSGYGWYQSNANRPQPDYDVAWTNGTGAADPSRVTFSDTQVGVTSTGVPITLTGTVSLTRGGGLVTLN